jgi:hypothetical protein
MTLAEQFQTEWNEGMNTATEGDKFGENVRNCFDLAGTSIIRLAMEIDRLRDDLVAKGLLESAPGVL